MFRSFAVFLFSALFSVPCLAEISSEDFSRLDLNGDGVVSREEFSQGMNKSGKNVSAGQTDGISAAERQKIINETVLETKKILPYKVDQATTWTDIYGTNDTIHYVYSVDMDTDVVPAENMAEMRALLESMVCSKIKPAMCGVANNVLLKNGISLVTHYNDNSGKSIGECRFSKADCL